MFSRFFSSLGDAFDNFRFRNNKTLLRVYLGDEKYPTEVLFDSWEEAVSYVKDNLGKENYLVTIYMRNDPPVFNVNGKNVKVESTIEARLPSEVIKH